MSSVGHSSGVSGDLKNDLYLSCIIAAITEVRLRKSEEKLIEKIEINKAARFCKYSGRKVTESLGNVTVRGEKDGRSKGEGRL
jgi:hypothetical protein